MRTGCADRASHRRFTARQQAGRWFSGLPASSCCCSARWALGAGRRRRLPCRMLMTSRVAHPAAAHHTTHLYPASTHLGTPPAISTPPRPAFCTEHHRNPSGQSAFLPSPLATTKLNTPCAPPCRRPILPLPHTLFRLSPAQTHSSLRLPT
ncbi:hypothetical protein BCR34DRAFT_263097 [Clohesyomyces aquaticus]|uniref:Uncharacterized protein n=1 Tax=Clohesyomyces aquaticus TaxID=1231657 RepID=A0A1Y1ZT76_9PLEO|nr:hypothetical protein BCR34DRAFT_263097 [Clohesyomyces aquaticus]